MSRKVWVTGLVLVVVGVAAMVLVARPPLVPRLTPMDELAYVLLGLVPAVGLVCATVGAVMLALALTGSLLGRPVVTASPAPLALVGLGAVVAAEVVGAVVGFLASSWPMTPVLLLSHAGGILQMVGSALLALWLTGRLSGAPADDALRRPAAAR